MGINDLIKSQVKNLNGESTTLAWGIVTTASPLAVTFTGETSAQSVKKLSSYTPIANDYVLLLKTKNTYICIGKVE